MSFIIIYSSGIKLFAEINSLFEQKTSLQTNFLINSKLQQVDKLLEQLNQILRRETNLTKKQAQKE
jgi:hypothetical protein